MEFFAYFQVIFFFNSTPVSILAPEISHVQLLEIAWNMHSVMERIFLVSFTNYAFSPSIVPPKQRYIGNKYFLKISLFSIVSKSDAQPQRKQQETKLW